MCAYLVGRRAGQLNYPRKPGPAFDLKMFGLVPGSRLLGSDFRTGHRFWPDYGLTGMPSHKARAGTSSAYPFRLPCRIKGCHSEAVYLFDSSIACRTEKNRIKRGVLIRV
jgi:hypothetical protein